MLPGPHVAARRAVEARLAAAGLPPPRIVVEVGNTAAQLTGLLLGSDLITLMSAALLDAPNNRGVEPIPLADARFRCQIGVLTRRDARLPPLAERFIDILRELRA